jgi:hypothetical protein
MLEPLTLHGSELSEDRLAPLRRLAMKTRLDPEPSLARARSAADVLAGLFDLHGSVRLAALLDGQMALPRVSPDDAVAPHAIAKYARKRCEAIEKSLAQAVREPSKSRVSLPDATSTHAVLSELGLLGRRDKRAATNAARSLGTPYRELITFGIARARAEIEALREEIAGPLRTVSEEARALEALDSVLRTATQKKSEALFARVPGALDGAFVEALVEHCAKLPLDATPATIRPWFSRTGVRDGWIGRHHAACEALVMATFEHERTALMALVLGACQEGSR